MVTRKSLFFLLLVSYHCGLALSQTTAPEILDDYDVLDYGTTNIPIHLSPTKVVVTEPKTKALISAQFYDDPLRQGLQPFYVISNFIIDEVIKPSIPKCKMSRLLLEQCVLSF